MRTSDEAKSDEEDVFEFELPVRRGLVKEKGPSKDKLTGDQSGPDGMGDSSSESSDSEEEMIKSAGRKRVCRVHDNKTNEELTDVFYRDSTSEEEFE